MGCNQQRKSAADRIQQLIKEKVKPEAPSRRSGVLLTQSSPPTQASQVMRWNAEQPCGSQGEAGVLPTEEPEMGLNNRVKENRPLCRGALLIRVLQEL